MRRTRSLALTVAALVAVSLAIPTSASAAATIEPGILVSPSAHELPAPSISVADDGRALIVWTGDDPGSTERCTAGGANCFIMGRLMNADGTFDGDPFAISAGVPIDYYFAPASAAWNSTDDEWLVTFTDYDAVPEAAYAQRVSSSGTLLGSLISLPVHDVTPPDDRTLGAVITDDFNSLVNITATWSPELEAYFVTWWADALGGGPFETEYGFSYAALGMFLNAAGGSVDGLDAAFLVSDDGIGASTGNGYAVETAYDPTTETWLTTWVSNSPRERKGAHVTLDPTISVDTAFTMTSISSWDSRIIGGSTIWVPSLGVYMITWSGRELEVDPYAVWGRTIDGTTLGAVRQLSDFDAEEFGGEPLVMNFLYRSRAAVLGNTLHLAAHVDYEIGDTGDDLFRALTWPVDLTSFAIGDEIALVGVPLGDSARPFVSAGGGVVRAVWQDWPNGDYEDPAEVRVTGVLGGESAPELADTGAAETVALGTFAALLLAIGAALLITRRAQHARQK